jgi:DNA-binding response OmpR family regulator
VTAERDFDGVDAERGGDGRDGPCADGARYAAPVLALAKRVLVVEDDPTVAEVLTRYLEREGYEVSTVADGRAAVECCQRDAPDLMVLDVMLPGIDGLEVCRRVRRLAPVAVVMLTARGEEDDLVAGLELGADDYLTKPFSPRELVARVKAVLRRTVSVPDADAPTRVVAGDLEIDVAARDVRVHGEPVSLTAREFDLLVFLSCRPRQVFDKQELFERVWGFTFGDPATVAVHVRRLREKIEADPSAPRHLVTVWGAGYRFDP